MKQKPVTKNMMLAEVLTRHPEVSSVLMSYGLHCIGCSFLEDDTLESGAKLHGMNDELIEMMLKDINIIIKSNKSKG